MSDSDPQGGEEAVSSPPSEYSASEDIFPSDGSETSNDGKDETHDDSADLMEDKNVDSAVEIAAPIPPPPPPPVIAAVTVPKGKTGPNLADIFNKMENATVEEHKARSGFRGEILELFGEKGYQYVSRPGVPISNEKLRKKSKRVRCVCISDTHLREGEILGFVEGDILIVCGDICSHKDVRTIQNFDNFIGRIRRQYGYKDVVVVGGNHDFPLDIRYHKHYADILPPVEELQKMIFEDMKHPLLPNATYFLLNSTCKCQGVKIHGMSHESRTRGAFYLDEENYITCLKQIPRKVDVLVTHEPPFNILDLAMTTKNKSFDVCKVCNKSHVMRSHWGSPELKADIFRRIRPSVHCFGHVHDEFGWRHFLYNKKGEFAPYEYTDASNSPKNCITFINCALCWAPMRKPLFFDIIK